MAERRTIQVVDPEPREWQSQDGQRHLFFIQGSFADGDTWSIGVQPQNLDRTLERFRSLVGLDADYVLEHKGVRDGRDEWKLTDYPGKPSGSIPVPGSTGRSTARSGNGGGKPVAAGGRDDAGRSIEAQVAAKIAGDVLVAFVAADKLGATGNNVWEFVANGTAAIAAGIRAAAAAPGQNPTPATNGPQEPAGGPQSPSPAGNGGVAADDRRARLVTDGLRLYGSIDGIRRAWMSVHPDATDMPAFDDISTAELASLVT